MGRILGQINALTAELVDVVKVVGDEDRWSGEGIRSIEHFLQWRTGFTRPHVAQLLKVAASKESHPTVCAHLAEGVLTLDQAAAAVRAQSCDDTNIAELAVMLTINQLYTAVNHSNRLGPIDPPESEPTPESAPVDDAVADEPEPEPEPEPAAEPGPVDAVPEWARPYTNPPVGANGVGREFVSLTPTDDGQWRLSGMLDADHGALLDAALTEMFDRLRRHGDSHVTKTDALIAIANHSLDSAPSDRSDRYRIHLFLDPTVSPHATWIDGYTVPDAITELLTCDAVFIPTIIRDALATSIGRTTRVIPERTRRTVMQRDGARCANPLCRSTYGLEVHHIIHWSHQGPTDTWNLLTLCSRCHRNLHLHLLDVSGNADTPGGVVFTNEHGHPIRAGTGTPPATMPAPPSNKAYRHPLGERLQSDAHLFHRPLKRRTIFPPYPEPDQPDWTG